MELSEKKEKKREQKGSVTCRGFYYQTSAEVVGELFKETLDMLSMINDSRAAQH